MRSCALCSTMPVCLGLTLLKWRSWRPAPSRALEHFVGLGADRGRCHCFPTAPDARRWAELTDGQQPRENVIASWPCEPGEYRAANLTVYWEGNASTAAGRVYFSNGTGWSELTRREINGSAEMAELMMRAHVRASRENVELLLAEQP